MRGKEPSRAESAVMLARAYPVRTLLALLIVGIGLWLLAGRIFPSESGRIRATIEQIRDGLVEGNVDKVLANVSPYFSQEGVDKDELGAWLSSRLGGRPMDHVALVLRRVQIRGLTAEVDLSATVRSLRSEHYGATDWIVSLEKADGRWLVRKALPTEVNGYHVDGLRDLFRIY